MGLADIVPGVSGGTVALLFGIYERLIDNVRAGARALGALVKGDFSTGIARIKAIEWSFLLPLLAGVGVAFVALSSIIETLLHDHPEKMAGLFFGLVAASIVVAARQVRTWTPVEWALLVIVAVATFLLLGFQSGAVSDPSLIAFIAAGAIAICAMILPGISGSFLLLVMGMYAALLNAIHDRELDRVAVFMVGAVIGLALFSTLLGWLLDNHHDPLLAALTGLMIGSIRVLWPWPNGVGIISDEADEVVSGTGMDLPMDGADFIWPTLLAIGAFIIVVGLTSLQPAHDHDEDQVSSSR